MTFCWEHGAFAAVCALAALFAMMWRCEHGRRLSMERRVEDKLDQILRAEAEARSGVSGG
jgi:hypothetical protein